MMILHLIEATTDDSKPWAFKKVNKSKIYLICIIKENQKFHLIGSICKYPVAICILYYLSKKYIELPI